MNGREGVSVRRIISVCCWLACAGLFSSCGTQVSGGAFSSDDYPFSFEYPADWTLTQSGPEASSSGTVTAALREPLDQVQLTSFRMKKSIPATARGNQSEADAIVQRVAARTGGSVGVGKPVTYGGSNGFRYIVEYSNGGMNKLRARLVFLFHGEMLVQINCQSSLENRKQLAAGCNEILDSLKLK